MLNPHFELFRSFLQEKLEEFSLVSKMYTDPVAAPHLPIEDFSLFSYTLAFSLFLLKNFFYSSLQMFVLPRCSY